MLVGFLLIESQRKKGGSTDMKKKNEKNGQESYGLFKKAVNQQAYLKAGIMGFAGSGKTYTAALMAEGIVERLKTKKPVFFLDTETGSDFLIPKFKEHKIDLYASKSRAFNDLLEAIKMAETNASVLIIDSVSHFWQEIQDAYKKANNKKRLTYYDWGPIKDEWRKFTDLYLNSNVHIIMCGRAAEILEPTQNDDGVKELTKVGTKMKVEKDLGYEPSLLVEMEREFKMEDGRRSKVWDHTCYVLKDRSQLIHGMKFLNPTFKDFEPVFDFLNIGGEHVGVETDKNSQKLFEGDGDSQKFKRDRDILLEKIQGEITSAFPGQTANDKKQKLDVIAEAFGTKSWIEVSGYTNKALEIGLEKIQKIIKGGS